MQSLTHGPHMNHGPSMHQYHGNHVMSNHVMGSVPDVHKRDKDAIYGYVFHHNFYFTFYCYYNHWITQSL
jgi:hypothetical protein